jgi:hypothetical protein
MALIELKLKMKAALNEANEVELRAVKQENYPAGTQARLESIYRQFQILHRQYFSITGKIWDKSI